MTMDHETAKTAWAVLLELTEEETAEFSEWFDDRFKVPRVPASTD